MAKAVKLKEIIRSLAKPKRTSIGRSPYSRPTNKHARRRWKKYRGQG